MSDVTVARRRLRFAAIAIAVGLTTMTGCASPTQHHITPTAPSLVEEPTSLMDLGIHTGVGDATFAFTPTGAFDVQAACIGSGFLTITVSETAMAGSSQQPCDGTQEPADYPSWCKFPTTLTVAAGAAVR